MARYGRPSAATSASYIVTIDGCVDSVAMRSASASNAARWLSPANSCRSTLTATRRRGRRCWYRKTSENPPDPMRETYSKPSMTGGGDGGRLRLIGLRDPFERERHAVAEVDDVGRDDEHRLAGVQPLGR